MVTVIQRGRNGDVDTGTEDLTAAGATINFPSAAAATNVISSSANDAAAGTGARTVRVKGVDANWKAIEENATLNGTTLVTLTNEYLRINSIEVLTVGSGGVNAGTIDVRHTTTVLCRVAASDNISGHAAYSVPVNFRSGRVVKWGGFLNGTIVVTLQLKYRLDAGPWRIIDSLIIDGDAFNNQFKDVPFPLIPKSDIRVEATTPSDNAVIEGFLHLVFDNVVSV